MSEKHFTKIVGTVKQMGPEESRVLRFVGSTETPDRSDDVISVTGWDVASYLKNPVLLWAHDYTSPPIGKAQSVYIDERSKSLVFDIKFPSIEEISNADNPSEHALFVDTIYKMYKAGILNAVSVGFRGIEYGPRTDQADKPVYSRGIKFDKQELLELSAVPVPANPEALVTARSISGISTKGIDMVFEKSVIPFKHYALADENASWDGPAVIAESEVEDLKIICTWYDSENPDVKSSYKLPHHMGKGNGYKTVWKGVAAAMGALLGSRGGVNIPEADKEKCYNHLKKHYAEFDKDVPDYKAIDKENDMEIEALVKRIEELEAKLAEIKRPEEKANRRLSQASIARVEACQNHMMKAMDELKGLVSDGVVEDDTPASDGVERSAPSNFSAKSTVDEINEHLRKNAEPSKE